uniref:Putative methyltransferase n=1 Tax=viral metagenome TaxID=1070528 RepID=A0A6M3L1C9_9ZZZZ
MIKLIHGDCIEEMRKMPDKSIDMILTDPPYGISFKSRWQTYQKHIINDGFDEWKSMLPRMLTEFKRILTDTGCCCCCGGGGKTPVTAIFTMEAIKHFNLIQTLVWRKFIGLGWRYRPSYENIVVLSKDSKNYNFYDTSKKCTNVIEGINQDIPTAGKDGKLQDHPTQKPVSLMKYLLKIHSVKGHTVLDPFMGGGSTGMACKEFNRDFVGIEIEQEYFNIAKKRIDNTQESFF